MRNRDSYLRKVLLAIYCIGGSIYAFPQVENIPISEQVRMDRLYLGLLANTQLSTEDAKHANEMTFQAGTRLGLWLIPDKIRIRSFAVIKLSGDGQIQRFSSFGAVIYPNDKINIQLGIMATPTTELRPNPTTWQSQVETHAESNIVGGRPGGKINFAFSQDSKLTYGLYQQDGRMAHHLKVDLKQLQLASYLRAQELFFALKWSTPLHQLVLTQFKDAGAFSAIISIIEPYRIYADMEYDFAKDEMKFGEWGIRRYFSADQLLKGFFSINYKHKDRLIQGGLFIHI